MSAVLGADRRPVPDAAGAKVTPAMQDYLKAVLALRAEGPVTIQRLAAALRVSSPSATNMVQRLTRAGYFAHRRYGDVSLTGMGEEMALWMTRRHGLLVRYLTQALGYSFERARLDADELEHHISSAFENRLIQVLEGGLER